MIGYANIIAQDTQILNLIEVQVIIKNILQLCYSVLWSCKTMRDDRVKISTVSESNISLCAHNSVLSV